MISRAYPSCSYTGDGLDFDAVMKIQEALKGLKWPLPRVAFYIAISIT
jgi:hypothetical protein